MRMQKYIFSSALPQNYADLAEVGQYLRNVPGTKSDINSPSSL